MNESGIDFQQGGCLYKPTRGIQWTPEHLWTSDRPQKQALKKKTSQLVAVVLWQLVSLLIELSIGNEKHSLPLCAYVTGFVKSSHIIKFYVHMYIVHILFMSANHLCE